METIDLHVHSCYSDGSFTPKELVTLALHTGLSAFALTDHDSIDGIDEAIQAAENQALEVIPGIEFSTRWEKRDIHILGYYIDHHAKSFKDKLQEFLDARDTRNLRMCERIREYTGFPITIEALVDAFPDAVITRAHMAAWLVDKGYVPSRPVAFEQYLDEHAPCFVSKTEVTPTDAIKLILSHGGIPVLAHPLLYKLSEEKLHLLLRELTEAGLMGIEAVYVLNKGQDETYVCSLAKQYHLLITGGSDFHGKNKPDIALGTGLSNNLSIPYKLLTLLKAARIPR